jgi:hypothetical protein
MNSRWSENWSETTPATTLRPQKWMSQRSPDKASDMRQTPNPGANPQVNALDKQKARTIGPGHLSLTRW